MPPLDGDGETQVRRALRTAADVISACPWCTDRQAMGPVRAVSAVLELLDRDDGYDVVSTRDVCAVLAEALDDAGTEPGSALLRWGPWSLDPSELVLRCTAEETLLLPLRQCVEPGPTLDYVLRVTRCPWSDAVVIAGLVRAVADVLRPYGSTWTRTPEQIARRVAECTRGR